MAQGIHLQLGTLVVSRDARAKAFQVSIPSLYFIVETSAWYSKLIWVEEARRLSVDHNNFGLPEIITIVTCLRIYASTHISQEKSSLKGRKHDDPAAFTILVNIVHAKNKAISSQIDLSLVTQFTILVDEYEMHEAAECIAGMRVDKLTMNPPDDIVSKTCTCLLVL
ncbi:hypothetical protein HYFRA_00011458 [Hymenoscyphus fraxineus]|uniref:Uncharacterized protein n=1 Tax=Hymenoscyphus fraxineus TaxID=746836 RepID=A0A9N9L5P6_9HELO|nr:hypothetical protein HYFRA_00011458 [Hymenoscyphus fraxineus]